MIKDLLPRFKEKCLDIQDEKMVSSTEYFFNTELIKLE